ncbi:MAG: PHP domain-containing protein [Gemmatimonadaceae bacterium]|nr:PHP domain-containing protein [Gemmatimonadaceae bacterium]
MTTLDARDAGFVDLHAHSTASDGTCAPEAIGAIALGAGLTALALTDHDTIDGIAAARAGAEALGVRLIAGTELSLFDAIGEVHILGLHLKDLAVLDATFASLREGRTERAQRMVEALNRLGVAVTWEAVAAHAARGAVGRPHVARAVVDAGGARDLREAFDKYLGNGRPACVEKRRLDVGEGIGLIHEAGGVAIWAHPAGDGRRERLEPLIAAGLDGLELKHPSHSKEDELRLTALADHFGLLPSGGSDWHGAMQGYRVMGSMHVPLEWMERQEQRAIAHRGAGR